MAYDFKTSKVKVSKVHISRGEPGSPWNCPIALAVKDIIPVPGFEVSVSSTRVKVYITGKVKWEANLPKTASRFVDKVDFIESRKERIKKLKPFNFMLTFKAV